MPTIEDRLNRIEVSMVRWRRAAVALALALAVLVTVGAQSGRTPDSITVRRLIVTDMDGREAISMSGPYLSMKNPDTGKVIFGVESSGNRDGRGDGLLYTQAADGSRIMMMGRKDGHGFVSLHDADGKNTMYGPSYR